jgi:Mu transposase, C-terminal domain
MITDPQVRKLRRLDRQGLTKELAALKAGIDPKTARKYRRLGTLPSEVKRMDRDWRTRTDPFASVWPELEPLLQLNPGLEAKTLFADLQRRYPGRFADGQLRTLQRRVKRWRAEQGPPKEVFFAQVHHPGRLAASDFTHCTDLRVTISGVVFEHLIYHFVLTYSNWETGTICFAESYESLSEGLQNALWELGGAPQAHRTDRLTAAVPPGTTGATFTPRYGALLRHYGLVGQAIQATCANENGDAEQSHRQFKRALDQALMLRGSRDFAGRPAYESFLRHLFGQLNAGRAKRLAEELTLLRPLPARRLESCKRRVVRVDSGSTIHVESNTYSVASRLIGERVEARVYAERIEVWYAGRCVEQLPRLRGRGKHRVEYRHVIDWLVRKPGAFADYRYRADLFPSVRFRLAYDVLCGQQPGRAAKEYLGILHLAARQSERDVEAALGRLLDGCGPLSTAAVEEELAKCDRPGSPLAVAVWPVDLASYDALLCGKEVEDGDWQGREGDAGGLPEGVAPAGVPSGLRGAGASGATGGPKLRAVPAATGGAGVPGASGAADGASAAAVASAVGEELAEPGTEASAGEGGAAGADAAGGFVRGSVRERAGVWCAGERKDPSVVRNRSGAGACGSEGAVLQGGAAGAGVAGGETGSETESGAEASGGLRGADRGRPGLRATEPRGDGGAVRAAGGAIRAWECAADEQPAVLRLGVDLQGRDDDGGGDRPSGASQRDIGAEHPELPRRAGEEGEAGAG